MLVFSVASPAQALQLGDPDELLSIEIHGFVSQGFLYTSHGVNYLATSSRGSFEFTEIGLNVTKQLTEKLRFGMQLFSRDLGPLGNYTLRADWFYLDYRFTDWIGLRAGRTKLPFGLYNDTSDIDAARLPVLLPQSVYPTQNRDFLLALTGAEAYGYVRLGPAGGLDYRIYGGTIFVEKPSYAPQQPAQITDINVPYIVGGRLLYETPLQGLRIGGSVQALELDGVAVFEQPPPTVTVTLKVPALLWVVSAEYSAHDVLVALEYSRWHTATSSDDAARLPSSAAISERAYVMGSYRVNRWFQPGIYYSLLYPNVNRRLGRGNEQHDLAATLRFDIVANHWLVKLEAHYMAGTAALQGALNNNVPAIELPNHWALLMLKTTAYF